MATQDRKPLDDLADLADEFEAFVELVGNVSDDPVARMLPYFSRRFRAALQDADSLGLLT